MLISFNEVKQYMHMFGIECEGALHIGAHDCEELPVYIGLGISASNVIWIDAIQDKVNENIQKGIPNVYCEAISDKDNDEVTFYRTTNDQSSSILPLETHAKHYPWITIKSETKMNTITIDTFLKKTRIDATKLHFWNFDIQGAEMLALMGASDAIQHAKIIYLEVNKEELYKGCALIEDIDLFLNQKGFIRVNTMFVEQGWGDAMYIRIPNANN